MQSGDLSKKKCVPCKPNEDGVPVLTKDQAQGLLTGLKGWRLIELKIEKDYTFKNFAAAIQFVNALAALAESEGHHPDIRIEYNKVTVTNWTHTVSGLTENDFILAAKTDMIHRG
jgi:4a-hydroxytetrahydrobiopterin dehydratase